MTPESKAAAAIADLRDDISRLDDEFVGEVVGTSQALDLLRKALDAIDTCLDTREFEKAAALGYGAVSENFIFLQRTLGGLNKLCMDKSRIVSEVAQRMDSTYEEALPFVDAEMVSAKPRTEQDERPPKDERAKLKARKP